MHDDVFNPTLLPGVQKGPEGKIGRRVREGVFERWKADGILDLDHLNLGMG